jgi:hypothetical protein
MSERCALTKLDEPKCDRLAVVRICDRYGGSGVGCHTHAARALREIAGARVEPLAGHDGAAIAVYNAARRR